MNSIDWESFYDLWSCRILPIKEMIECVKTHSSPTISCSWECSFWALDLPSIDRQILLQRIPHCGITCKIPLNYILFHKSKSDFSWQWFHNVEFAAIKRYMVVFFNLKLCDEFLTFRLFFHHHWFVVFQRSTVILSRCQWAFKFWYIPSG